VAKHAFLSVGACLRSVNDNKRVLIVQYRPKDACFVWIREAGGDLWGTKEGIEPVDILEEVKKVLDESKATKTPFDLCIHDGVTVGKDVCDHRWAS
jgi:hypothetical protein